MRLRASTFIGLLAFAILLLLRPAYGLAQDRTCDILAENLRQDVLTQGSSQQQFRAFQRLLSDERYSDYETASKSSLDFGVSIPSIVDGTLGTKSDSSNWGKNWSRFLTWNAGQSAEDLRAAQQIRVYSDRAMAAIERCVQTFAQRHGGIYAVLSVPIDRASFALLVTHDTRGGSDWTLTSFDAQPRSAITNCTEAVQDLQKPLVIHEATHTFSCQKDPSKRVVVTINSTAGSPPESFEIVPLQDDLQALRDEQSRQQGLLATAQNAIAALQSELARRPAYRMSTVRVYVDESRCIHPENVPFMMDCHLDPPPSSGEVIAASIGRTVGPSAGQVQTHADLEYTAAGGHVLLFKPAVQGGNGYFGGGWKWEFELIVFQTVQ